MLWCVVLSAVVLTARAEEFGISRRYAAQPPPPPSQKELPYVVRIIAFDSSGQSFGTGSYVGTYGEYGVILTNWHVVFTEEKETEGLVHVHFPSGFSSYGAVVKSDPLWDLALIVISKPPPSIPLLTVSQTPPKPGDPLWIAGFGSGSYRMAAGRCVQYIPPEKPKDGTAPLYEIIEVSVSARKGDSGGPILNQKEELAGVLFGSDMVRNTAGSYCMRVNRFLMETYNEMAAAELPNRPETHFASKEKDGPLHSLRESRNILPPNTTSQRSTVPASPVSPSGVRSSNRRFSPPVSVELPRIPQQVSPPIAPDQQIPSPTAPVNVPFSLLPPLQELQPVAAAWAETSSKIGRSVQPTKVIQTAHLVPLEALSPTMLPSLETSVVDRYLLKLSADRRDILFTLFLSLNVFTAAGLTFFAVRLLRT